MNELTEAERYALWQAGDHHPDVCDCAGSDWSADGEWCGILEDTFAEVERIIDARLAPIRALADEFDGAALGTDFFGNPLTSWVPAARLRAALSAPLTAPQPTSGTEGQLDATQAALVDSYEAMTAEQRRAAINVPRRPR